MRLIDADTLYKKMTELEMLAFETLKVQEDNTERQRWQTILNERTEFTFDIADAPTIDAVPVKYGRWIRLDNNKFKCSICGIEEYVPTSFGSPCIWNYCPFCGIKMVNKLREKI